MIEWLVKTLELKVPEGAEVRFEWGNLPRGEEGLMLVLAVVGAVLLTGWLYRREGRASGLRKGFLAVCRVLVFAALLSVFLEPRLAVDHERTVEGQTIVLWDTSLSMSLSDRYIDETRRAAMAEAAGIENTEDLAALTRQELAWRIVERAKLLDGLAEKNKLQIYGFDGKARALTPPLQPADLEPEGNATDLAAALRKALEETGGRSVAAVVAVTDGRINKGEGQQGVIAALEGRRIPFFAIGIGDPTPPVNLEVVDLSADPRVLLGDPLAIEATVRARGFEGQTVEAVFSLKAQGAAEPTVLERRDIVFEADDRPIALRFTYKPDRAADLVFSLELPAREDEPVVSDNVRTVPVKITDEKTRVLLIAGGPSFEYHFLKTRLIREKAAIVSCWLQSADGSFPQDGNTIIESMPSTIEELREYDAVVLIDPSPETFDGPIAAAMKSFVADSKGGLLYIPGPKHAASFLSFLGNKAILDLMPVIPGDLPGGRVTATERWPYQATPDGVDHPATRLNPNPQLCRSYWARLPGAFFSFPVQREKAGAVTLVRHEDPSTIRERGHQPVIAAHYFDGGPVVWQGTDEIWRWRSVAPRIYDRYWVGMLRFLVQGRLAGGRKRVELLADKEVYYLGEPIHVRAHAYDRSYRPLLVSELEAKATVGDEEILLRLLPSKGRKQPGWYEATLVPPGQGTLEITARLPDDDPGATPASLKVLVKRPDLEFAMPRLDEETLSGIAAATSGMFVGPADVAGLPELIPSRTENLVVAGTPIALWDQWHVILLVCLLLTIEWIVRKRSRMV